jgi:serine/threonine protein phosphatase PrpC
MREQGYSPSQPNKPNQDSVIMMEHRESDSVLLAVFDGHGDFGHVISSYFRDNLPEALFASQKFYQHIEVADNVHSAASAPLILPPVKNSNFPPIGPARPRRDVAGALREALSKCEAAVLRDSEIDCSLSGCTACVVVVSGADVTAANIGDSRCVLLRKAAGEESGLAAIPLTVDHKPTLPSETKRLLIKGGRVQSIKYEDGGEGPMRVWLRDDDIPGLAMSRSLGDTVGKKAGVISEPDFYFYTLTQTDAFLTVASDGLWEFTTLPEVAAIIDRTFDEARHALHLYNTALQDADAGDQTDQPPPDPPQHLELALEALSAFAAERWQQREGVIDDTSIIVAEIGCTSST